MSFNQNSRIFISNELNKLVPFGAIYQMRTAIGLSSVGFFSAVSMVFFRRILCKCALNFNIFHLNII